MKGIGALLFFPCRKTGEFVYDYLEGRLGRLTAARFEMHLSRCGPCHEYVLLYRGAADGALFREANPPPPELLEKTLSFLECEGVLDRNRPKPPAGPASPPAAPPADPESR